MIINRHRTHGAGLGLLLAIGAAAGCNGDNAARRGFAPTPLPPPAAAPAPTPTPTPAPVVPHLIDLRYDPDMYNTTPPRDGDGSYLLDWGAGWYCVWLNNIPDTPEGHCREYLYTFSWLPSSRPDHWAGSTYNRGCHLYPNRFNPGPCFESPARGSIGDRQSIAIVGMERGTSGTATAIWRTEVGLRFRDP